MVITDEIVNTLTLDQALAFGVIGVTIGLFVWGRLPYDLVALLAIVAGVATGVVKPGDAFHGFSDDVVIIVASALLISAAVSRSGVVESAMRPVLPHLTTPATQVPVLCAVVMGLSALTEGVGVLAIFMPVALQLARRTGTPPALLLMPMAFASLIGGLITLVGSSTNVILSKVRADIVGQPFAMFDFTPVGLSLGLIFLGFVALAYRLLPRDRRPAGSLADAFRIDAYTTEARLPAGSPLVGARLAELEAMGEGGVGVGTVIRERFRRYAPTPDWRLQAGDILLLDGEPEDLERLVARARLDLIGAAKTEGVVSVVEAVVPEGSPLDGVKAGAVDLDGALGVSLIAVSRSGTRVGGRLTTQRLRAGDVVVLRGADDRVPHALSELRLLPLAERSIALGHSRRGYIPIVVLGLAMMAVALEVVPVAFAFFAAAVALLILRVMTMREAYETVDWSVIVLLGALIPVAEAVRTTGGTDLIAGWMQGAVQHVPPIATLSLVMVTAMLVTPFLNNAATVLVVAPIGASLAARLGLNPDPFLMAVAVGATCDFLTPIGNPSNSLVMGPAGYRFGDYARLGLPLVLVMILAGTGLIALVWPLAR